MNQTSSISSYKIWRGELALLLAVAINSFGVVLMLYSGTGISAISSVPYAFSEVFPKISLGTWTYIFQGLLVLSLMILRKRFVPSYLFSFVVGFAFSELLDVHELWISILPTALPCRVLYFAISPQKPTKHFPKRAICGMLYLSVFQVKREVHTMVQYLAKRIGRSVLTLFIIVTLVFCLLRLMPVEGYFANYEKMTEAQIQAGLQSMGLLDPLPVQIGHFWRDALHGDLGVSHIYKLNAPVTKILAQKLPISIEMGVLAMLLSLVLGIPLGLVMGRCKNRWPDKLGTALIVLIQAVPAAVYFLYIQMYGTSVLGVGLLFDAANWRYWVLPVCSMSLANLAFYAMWLRRYMVDESNKDYVKLARAKGVSENNIALHHVFRNAMVPLVQYIPSAFLNTVVGSIYIESLYSIPGMGGLLVTCVQRHDNTMVQGIVLLYACVGIIGLILGDVLMVLIDPRINFGKKEGGR